MNAGKDTLRGRKLFGASDRSSESKSLMTCASARLQREWHPSLSTSTWTDWLLAGHAIKHFRLPNVFTRRTYTLRGPKLCFPLYPLVGLLLLAQTSVGHAELEVLPLVPAFPGAAVSVERLELVWNSC